MKIQLLYKPLIWLALICYGLYLPASRLPEKPFLNIPYFDKIVHFIFFFVLCLLLFRPLKILKKNHLFLAPAISIFFGAVFEFTQQFISSTRNSNIYDFLTNCIGIAVAWGIYYFFISDTKWEKYF
jgi:VanZ family protein